MPQQVPAGPDGRILPRCIACAALAWEQPDTAVVALFAMLCNGVTVATIVLDLCEEHRASIRARSLERIEG